MQRPAPQSRPTASALRRALTTFGVLCVAMPAALAGDWYVDGNYSGCSGSDGSAAKPYCTIAKAITAASQGDTIHIAPDSYLEALAVGKSLTFLGTAGAASTLLDGSNVRTIASLTGAVTVTFSGVTFTRGQPALSVGSGCQLTLTDCNVRDCTALERGGGIRADDAAVVIERCNLSNNMVGNVAGGAGQIRSGGAIDAVGGTLTLLDSSFSGNRAGGAAGKCGSGGAVQASDGALVVVERCGFFDNVSLGGEGGAVALTELEPDGSLATPVTASFSDCTFQRNDADTNGGALKARRGTNLTLRFCYFERNGANNGGALDYSVGFNAPNQPVTIAGCRFLTNGGTDHLGSGGIGGALRLMNDDLALSDCSFTGNFAGEGRYSAGVGGALRMQDGTVTRCSFIENRAEGTKEAFSGGLGGGAYVNGDATFTDCIFERNLATNRLSNQAGNGGGLMFGPNKSVTLRRCTVAGNVANTTHGKARGGARGGGIEPGAGSTLLLDHCIIASNFAQLAGPDLRGRANLIDYNCIGDTQDAILLTTGPNDLLDIDPEFVDDVSGDFSLRPTSPCIDSGDPSLHVDGKDVQAFPRTLDGDLDGQLRIDRGGHEFSHVRIALSGSFTPGGTITVTSSGLAGFGTFLIVGDAEGRRALNGFGELYVELLAPFVLLPWLPLPSVVDVDVDPAFPVPATFYVQEFAYGGGAGNLSNLVRLDLR
ncbi:MAG: hypothetical protein JNL90_02025 [Planctomycetes bacterium]|nr:hypothetical protein [Planctomycetota bacterium]